MSGKNMTYDTLTDVKEKNMNIYPSNLHHPPILSVLFLDKNCFSFFPNAIKKSTLVSYG